MVDFAIEPGYSTAWTGSTFGTGSDYCEMENRHRNILRRHRFKIRMDLEPENILAKLVEILSDTDEGEIKAETTREKKCDKLLEILPRKGPNASKVFVEALIGEASHLASDLIEAGNKEESYQSSALSDRSIN